MDQSKLETESQFRLRVQNCIGTILDVHRMVSSDIDNQDFLDQFEKLKKAVEDLDMSSVSEGDILMVEQATNSLLEEFESLFEMGGYGPVYARKAS